ncbi:Ger(x)C family spore germination protein [Paenibacillus sinopodophylli]|uniref:Ger(x)C family spore germination protein n=1 Tax=Paenibacillus sinopodophylli TaxID=1837342 RepID=UPI001486993B|nr:Ger(x)C family spore germination protein [Paenibacillus sinopodophylli]
MVIRYLKCIVAASMIMMISGCWSQINFDQLTVVSAIGLDLDEDQKLQVSLQLVNPTLPVAAGGATQQRRAVAIYTATGHTIHEAIEIIKKQSKKNLFFSQTRAILISEKLAKNGLSNIVDYFWREPNQNFNSWVLISNSTAKDALSRSKELLAVSSDEWKAYLKDKTNNTARGGIELYQFLSRLNQSSYEAAVPGISPFASESKQIIMEIGKLAVFNGDKMSGWLSLDESRIVNWLSRSSKTGVIQVKIKNDEFIDFDLTNIHIKTTAQFKNNQLVMSILMKCDAHIKTSTEALDLASQQVSHTIETKLNQYLNTGIKHTLHKTFDTYQSDAVGFGDVVHRTYPEKWKSIEANWGATLKTIELAVDTDVRLVKSGLLINRSIKKDDKDD